MSIERDIRMIGRSINTVYYTIYLITILIVLVVFYITFAEIPVRKLDPMSDIASKIQSVYLFFLLTSIPLALYLFHKHTLKLQREEDRYVKLTKYRKAAITRLWVVGFGLLLGVTLVFFMRSQSMVFASGIAAIALYFCKPSRTKLIRELDLDVDSDSRSGDRYV